jgi:hypothetical protein
MTPRGQSARPRETARQPTRLSWYLAGHAATGGGLGRWRQGVPGAPVSATIATAIGAAALAAGGPILMRKLRAIMLSNRAGSRR